MDEIDALLQAAVDAPEPPVSDQIESYRTALQSVDVTLISKPHELQSRPVRLDLVTDRRIWCIYRCLQQRVYFVHCSSFQWVEVSPAKWMSLDG